MNECSQLTNNEPPNFGSLPLSIPTDITFYVSLLVQVVGEIKGWVKKNLTDQILFSLYLDPGKSDIQNFGVYPP
jgi:hypothetical protein